MTGAPTRLVLVRHGQTDANAGGRFQGHQDVPLNRIGRSQAESVAVRVAALNPDRIVSSDLSRAVATAEPLAERVGLTIETDVRLREIDVGSWQGLTRHDIAAAHPWFETALANGEDFRRSEAGETAAEAGARIAEVLTDLAERFPGQTSVVVGHGLALRVGIALWLGWGLEPSFGLAGLWNGSVSLLTATDRRRLVAYNTVV